jgi:lysophospholipase L1-like esterase
VDYVLDPAEITQLNDLIKAIDTYIATQATTRGWAFFRLDALFGRTDLKAPFSVAALMTTATPYGPLMSLDGFHPSAQGQTVLADAAARAINEKYRTTLPTGVTALIAP